MLNSSSKSAFFRID